MADMPDARQRESGSPAPGSSIGAKLDDSVVTTKVKTALIADDDIDGADISVETRSGHVGLSGTAGSQAQVDRALKLARAVDGVRSVTSRITVKQ